MKRLFSIACCNVAALVILSLAATAQTPTMAKPTPAPAKNKAATKTTAPKADADIQKCIQDKVSSGKFKDDSITVTVTGSEATLAGTTKIGGHKGNATQFAKRCGATKVTNNITVESTPKSKSAKAADKGTSQPKKP